MNTKSLYELITLKNPCTQNEFLTYLDLTVKTLIAQYSMPYVISKGESWGIPRSVESDVPVEEEYFPALADNILFLVTGDGDRKTDYVAEAEAAFKSVWSRRAKGVKLRDRRYGDV